MTGGGKKSGSGRGKAINKGARPQGRKNRRARAKELNPTSIKIMNISTIILILLIVLLIGALPAWPYSSGWGYYPSGGLGVGGG